MTMYGLNSICVTLNLCSWWNL